MGVSAYQFSHAIRRRGVLWGRRRASHAGGGNGQLPQQVTSPHLPGIWGYPPYQNDDPLNGREFFYPWMEISWIMQKHRTFLLLICLVAAGILLSGCTSQDSIPSTSVPTPEATQSFTTPTQPSSVPTPDFVVVKKQETVPTIATSKLVLGLYSISGWNSSSPLLQPGAGNEYVVVDFSLKNVGALEGYAYRPEAVKLMDSSGQQYTYHDASYSLVNAFRESTIPINETRRGRLVFEVPISPEGTQYSLMIG
ncbi:MAG: Telomeric repeat-binding factor 2 [Euryarchaeota archaeon ADurb.BinA087]|nr:MAG: Telomeric repeat-binding factor 2 [Euryarchaeota archaeon ADurb.BinA087]